MRPSAPPPDLVPSPLPHPRLWQLQAGRKWEASKSIPGSTCRQPWHRAGRDLPSQAPRGASGHSATSENRPRAVGRGRLNIQQASTARLDHAVLVPGPGRACRGWPSSCAHCRHSIHDPGSSVASAPSCAHCGASTHDSRVLHSQHPMATGPWCPDSAAPFSSRRPGGQGVAASVPGLL